MRFLLEILEKESRHQVVSRNSAKEFRSRDGGAESGWRLARESRNEEFGGALQDSNLVENVVSTT
jgi:hypothetical protein